MLSQMPHDDQMFARLVATRLAGWDGGSPRQQQWQQIAGAGEDAMGADNDPLVMSALQAATAAQQRGQEAAIRRAQLHDEYDQRIALMDRQRGAEREDRTAAWAHEDTARQALWGHEDTTRQALWGHEDDPNRMQNRAAAAQLAAADAETVLRQRAASVPAETRGPAQIEQAEELRKLQSQAWALQAQEQPIPGGLAARIQELSGGKSIDVAGGAGPSKIPLKMRDQVASQRLAAGDRIGYERALRGEFETPDDLKKQLHADVSTFVSGALPTGADKYMPSEELGERYQPPDALVGKLLAAGMTPTDIAMVGKRAVMQHPRINDVMQQYPGWGMGRASQALGNVLTGHTFGIGDGTPWVEGLKDIERTMAGHFLGDTLRKRAEMIRALSGRPASSG